MEVERFKCPICDEFFDKLRSLHLHCVHHHMGEFVNCPICNRPVKHGDFVNHSNLQHDRLMKRNNGIKQCDYKCTAPYSIDKRMISGSQCLECFQWFSSRYNARTHYKEVHLRITYLCHRCPKSYASLQYLKFHYRAKHGRKSIGKCIRSASTTNFAGFNSTSMAKAKATHMERIGLQDSSVLQRATSTGNDLKSEQGRITWTLRLCDDTVTSDVRDEATSLTHCDKAGIVKMRPNQMNDLDLPLNKMGSAHLRDEPQNISNEKRDIYI